MFETTVRDGACRCHSEGARWLVTGPDGGRWDADAVYNLTVPEGFDRTDLGTYREARLAAAGFAGPAPALFTGVSMAHARGARDGPVTALSTVGLSNPATLPVDSGVVSDSGTDSGSDADDREPSADVDAADWRPGTVNLVVGTARSLGDGTLAELLATCVEAKAATLSELAGVPGTTSDAVAVGCDPAGDPAAFAGSATEVGAAARACVRDAVSASFRSRYEETEPPDRVADADHGVVTDRQTDVFRP